MGTANAPQLVVPDGAVAAKERLGSPWASPTMVARLPLETTGAVYRLVKPEAPEKPDPVVDPFPVMPTATR